MTEKKKRNPRYVTDVGVAIYPYLTAPDTKFNADGEYKVKLRLNPDSMIRDVQGREIADVQTFLDDMMLKALEKAKAENKGRIKEGDPPYIIDDETGDLLVNFKLKAVVRTKEGSTFSQKPALFDAKGKPITPESIWGGSKIKVSFEVVPYYTKIAGAGVTLRLRAAQVLELVTGGSGGSAESYGFGEEEGYEADDEAANAGFAEAAEDEEVGYEDGDF